jgi:hypothetical protein
MAETEEDEVELKRFDSAFDAEMALDFVREHGVRARLKGTGTSNVLDRFSLVVDIRLMVPAGEREAGLAALDAMALDDESAEQVAQQREDDSVVHDGAYRARRAGEADDGPKKKDFRYRSGAVVGVVWFGGAHLNARQSVLGWFLFVTMWALFLTAVSTREPWMILAFTMLWIYDIAHGVLAVEQHNAGKKTGARSQLIHGLAVLLVASLGGMALAAARPPRPPTEDDPGAAPVPAR